MVLELEVRRQRCESYLYGRVLLSNRHHDHIVTVVNDAFFFAKQDCIIDALVDTGHPVDDGIGRRRRAVLRIVNARNYHRRRSAFGQCYGRGAGVCEQNYRRCVAIGSGCGHCKGNGIHGVHWSGQHGLEFVEKMFLEKYRFRLATYLMHRTDRLDRMSTFGRLAGQHYTRGSAWLCRPSTPTSGGAYCRLAG
ncbi:Leucine--tRNA ligase [Trichinella spiralis]|uniref:Leucine--tRNA ligase n=1 Tax=Trichinella spiralis TaxID=6334 RepID=A0ABR3K2X5_TRISP